MRELKLGSLMAQPCPDYVIAGIAEILKETEKLSELDGESGNNSLIIT